MVTMFYQFLLTCACLYFIVSYPVGMPCAEHMLVVSTYLRLKETRDRLAAKLEAIYTTSGEKKIDVVTHSMGGLLVKCVMSLHNDIFEKYVKSWIAIAAPFQEIAATGIWDKSQRSFNVQVSDVKNVIIWGNHSSTTYPDVTHATVGDKPVPELIKDDEWVGGIDKKNYL
ncbi:lecithin-cholesterol acyltransferase-like 4 protein, partial [Tanacetum coccineum]